MKIVVVSLSDADLKTLGLPSAEVLNLFDHDVRDVILATRFKAFRRWWRKRQGEATEPVMVV
jgi:hypothetical protein